MYGIMFNWFMAHHGPKISCTLTKTKPNIGILIGSDTRQAAEPTCHYNNNLLTHTCPLNGITIPACMRHATGLHHPQRLIPQHSLQTNRKVRGGMQYMLAQFFEGSNKAGAS